MIIFAISLLCNTGRVHKSTLVSTLNSGTKPSSDRLKRVRARQCRGGGQIDIPEHSSLRLYGEVVYGKNNIGRILKMTNSQGKSKLNYVKPITFDDHTAAAYPRLVLTIEPYICNDYERQIYSRSMTPKCVDVSVVSVKFPCSLVYQTELRTYSADEHLKTCLKELSQARKSSASTSTCIRTEKSTDNSVIPSTSYEHADGRVVTEVEPVPGARSQRRRRVITYDSD